METIRRAVIDVGTNSIKLLVADVRAKDVHPIHEESRQTRLGKGFYETHRLQPEAVAQVALELLGNKQRRDIMNQRVAGVVATLGGPGASQRAAEAILRHAAPLAFGVLNGFLPCPLVYAMVAQAASTVDVLSGFLTTAMFGLGTFPAMLAMGGLGRLLAPRWRRRGVRLAGGFILALGLVTLSRGIVPMAAGHGMHHLWHIA